MKPADWANVARLAAIRAAVARRCRDWPRSNREATSAAAADALYLRTMPEQVGPQAVAPITVSPTLDAVGLAEWESDPVARTVTLNLSGLAAYQIAGLIDHELRHGEVWGPCDLTRPELGRIMRALFQAAEQRETLGPENLQVRADVLAAAA